MRQQGWRARMMGVAAAIAVAGVALYAVAQPPGPGQGGPGFPGMGGMAFGTVKGVAGNTITVEMGNGESRQVAISAQTRLLRRDRGSLQDVKQGQKVMVQGRFDERGVWFLPSEITLGDGLQGGMPGIPGMGGGMGGIGEVVRVEGQMAQIVLNVSLKDAPQVYKVRQAKPNEVKPGDRMMAMGRPEGGTVQAMFAVVGEIDMPFGGGRGPGGGGNRGGGGGR